MPKVGRNDPCPCGSGKKYKRCCREKDEQQRLAGERSAVPAFREVLRAMASEARSTLEEGDRQAERVLSLIDAGDLDEAEACARKLEADFPDVTTGIERLGQVYEARGMRAEAAEEYRRAVGMMDGWGRGHYCDCCRARMVKAIRRLDPSGPSPELGLDPQ